MFGSKFELTEKQTSKLNSLLPESLKLETFEKKNVIHLYKSNQLDLVSWLGIHLIFN